MGEPPALVRVHLRVLTENSNVFKKMLTLPDSKLRDAPIAIPDVLEHFKGVMHVYYGPFLVPLPDDPNLDFFLGVLRVATKYRFMLARKWAVEKLRVDWSVGSARLSQLPFPYTKEIASDAIKVINAARELYVREFRGVAFWILWAAPAHADNVHAYASMHADDILLMVQGTQSVHEQIGSSKLQLSSSRDYVLSQIRQSVLTTYHLLDIKPEDSNSAASAERISVFGGRTGNGIKFSQPFPFPRKK
ncbi:hypothetical protein BOTBODRAFT_39138 [Botryobasidium botryosum FD-172 SS1]|uniref:BTB domain-containing protein n=1 Tax=Botryobasidium botryosum (strain FD-172 SS1) TaxID=930990 RepID=A0A067LXD0_BOTB1|nr:hypothetical protein BOTBODRAFT_39138 [Botryobasidium botryosum FD-172 SS1]